MYNYCTSIISYSYNYHGLFVSVNIIVLFININKIIK